MSVSVRRYASRFRGFGPDARRLLVATLLSGSVSALYAINFVPYLHASGFDTPAIAFATGLGAVAAGASGLVVAYLANVVGRQRALVASTGISAMGLLGLALADDIALVLASALYLAGAQGILVLEPALLRERSRRTHRDELFATHFAIVNGTGAAAAVAAAILFLPANQPGSVPGSDAYRLLLGLMAVALGVAVAISLQISNDAPVSAHRRARTSALARPGLSSSLRRLARLLLPWTLISLGSGQVMPYLSYFLQQRFGLTASATNLLFAGIGLAAMIAILAQPMLVTRVGRVRSIVLVQAMSVPLLLVIGFGPFLVVAPALFARSALMEAGHPIYNLSLMEGVPASLRPLVSSLQLLLLAGGVAIGSVWFAVLQRWLGFDDGFAVAWLTIVTSYAAAMALLPWSLRQPLR